MHQEIVCIYIILMYIVQLTLARSINNTVTNNLFYNSWLSIKKTKINDF